ncbi:hypothetical protein ACQUQU_17145 [Thalassolituus sp. LLYu03]|uniref:hypothetical protein n=1 Tax=Thalassolituus sp. LLYu03 TaxID=3421656 RepID=UPI003D2B3FFC
MSAYAIREARPEDSPALLKLLAATAQQGSIRLTFERAPDYFHAAAISTEEPEIWVMDKAGDGIIGTFSIGKRRVFINGQPEQVRYGSDLRIHPDHQGGRTLFRLFGRYRERMHNDWMQTVILDENEASLATVGSGRSILPQYIPAGHFTTWLISLRRRERHPCSAVRRATAADVADMQAFFIQQAGQKQFFPYYDFSRIGTEDPYYRHLALRDFFILREHGVITGIAALWDQKGFKQTRVTGYSRSLRLLRPLVNGITRLTGHLPLPAVNSVSSYLALHCVLVKDNQPRRFARLLRTIRHALNDSGVQAIACGFDRRDPLLNVARQYPGHALHSRHFIATYHPENTASLDLARLQYPEICRL